MTRHSSNPKQQRLLVGLLGGLAGRLPSGGFISRLPSGGLVGGLLGRNVGGLGSGVGGLVGRIFGGLVGWLGRRRRGNTSGVLVNPDMTYIVVTFDMIRFV